MIAQSDKQMNGVRPGSLHKHLLLLLSSSVLGQSNRFVIFPVRNILPLLFYLGADNNVTQS